MYFCVLPWPKGVIRAFCIPWLMGFPKEYFVDFVGFVAIKGVASPWALSMTLRVKLRPL